MKYLVYDIETRNTFQDVGSNNPADLDISVVSIYNSETDEVTSYLQEDFKDMWPLFESTDAIVGYNTEHFDTPLLNKYYPGDLHQIKSIDLMVYIKNSLGRRPKLDDIAEATLGNKKIAHGLEAVKWWKEGKVDEIIKYCEEDVKITRDVFKFAMENGFVKLKDFQGKTMEIPLDTSEWNTKEDNSMTFSMGF